MSKYPLLNIYRILAIILAVLLIILGVLTAIRTATNGSFESNFDLGAFIGSLLPFLGAAFGMGVVAELILLLLDVVDHLEHIRFVTDQQASRAASASEKAAAAAPRVVSSAPAYEPTIRVRATNSTAIRTKPDTEASASSQLAAGQSLPIYGRNSDSTWFTISRQGTLWLDAADVEIIEGYLSNLSVVEPT